MALLAAVFAMNHEQMNGLMLLLLLGILFCDIRKREFRKSLIPFYFINIVEFIIILTCPGNACRRNAETVSYYPVYGEYSFFHKVYEGICSLLKGIFDEKGMAVLTITILLLFIYLSFYNRQNVFIKLMSVMAFTYSVIKVMSFKVNILGTNRFFSDYRGSIGATVLGCCILGAIWMVCCANAKTIPERIGITWVMLSAAATKIVLGFSLAFLVSGERTSIYMFFVLLMLALYFIQKHEELEIFKKRWFFVGVCSVNLLMFAWNYYSLYVGKII